ncbi:MAG TPA: CRISPR-associated helicase Cas3' [Chitinivibrionales bacterium]|nr:CRISPR-associated helicase Cas3' [Chitinivibrionales bacterium]
MIKEFIAHTREDGQTQPLEEHLLNVAKMAADFINIEDWKSWAYLAGLWHDLGKYSEGFQSYIRATGKTDDDEEKVATRVQHAIHGAFQAIQSNVKLGKILAYIIAGHHAGLADWGTEYTGRKALQNRIADNNEKKVFNKLLSNIPDSIRNARFPQELPKNGSRLNKKNISFWIRVLYSCVVDADFLDTERFICSEKGLQRYQYPFLQELKKRFDSFMERKTKEAVPSKVNEARKIVLEQCKNISSQEPGFFSLSVPTGGGKTLSSMAFALNHALSYNKKRIIYVIPYTSIIEQTADVFRKVFGESALVEHHSNIAAEKDTVLNRLASENWDAPLIVTTSVQFFESLYAARSSTCRKLHNILNSVVILDEVQLLPPEFLQPILLAMNTLKEIFGVTFVLSTATQPALNENGILKRNAIDYGLKDVRPITEKSESLYKDLLRVEIKFPHEINASQTWDEIALELCRHESVLCIVNRRKDCRELFDRMPKGTLHLSALMHGAHRSGVIENIKTKLNNGENIRVVSTQLVEAGVDIDFPIVYRAFAGFDSIAQAAGRCNREGRLVKGKVYVFNPPQSSPSGLLLKAEQCTKELLAIDNVNFSTPEIFEKFFSLFYSSINDLDEKGIIDLVTKEAGKGNFWFRTAANRFTLIPEGSTFSVLILCSETEEILRNLSFAGPNRENMRKLQRYTVNLYKNVFDEMYAKGFIKEVYEGIWATTTLDVYKEDVGLDIYQKYFSSEKMIISE